MTHKMACDSRGWKLEAVCGAGGGHGIALSRADKHITCSDCLKYKGYRIEKEQRRR